MPLRVVDETGPPIPLLKLAVGDDGRHVLIMPRPADNLDDASAVAAFYAGKSSAGRFADMAKFVFIAQSDADTLILEDGRGNRLRATVTMVCPAGRRAGCE